MKKILALVLALAMVLCAASVLAEDSKDVDDTQHATTTTTDGEPVESLSLIIIDNTEATQAIIDTFAAAAEAGDVLSAFPEDVRAQIPEGLNQINEMVTAQFVGDTEAVAGDLNANVVFKTLFEAGSEAVAVASNGADSWNILKATPAEDGSVDIVCPAAFIKAVGNTPFVLAIVNK